MAEKFSSKTAFIMASVGSAVGLGNIFRFPALCVKYGIIYIIVYILLNIIADFTRFIAENASVFVKK
jgi:NSS family neurotransmitter:Na+ symporter